MADKMLIDASHPEETRVVVVRGNRIEEFDFESQHKKQLRGNIYLAKVTRVEPSLQAAFVDYGGNRHGFLAFSEIHPDYYQIPLADRQALLEAEAQDAENQEDEDDNHSAENVEDVAQTSSDDDAESAPKPKKKRSRRRKSSKSTADITSDDKDGEIAANSSDTDTPNVSDDKDAAQDQSSSVDSAEPDTEAVSEDNSARSEIEAGSVIEADAPSDSDTGASSANTNSPDSASEDDSDDNKPDIIAAIVETDDEISEPAPEADEVETNKAEADEIKAEGAEASEAGADAENAQTQAAETEARTGADTQDDAASEEAKPKRSRRKSTRKKTAKIEPKTDTESETEEDQADEGEDNVEEVGAEDALEEIPEVKRVQRKQYRIQEVIKRRQILLVQVVKEERGNKGAALTTYMSLAGRYSVLMPNTARGGGISRKITNVQDRKRLKDVARELEVPKGMGVILRTAGANRTKTEIRRDFEYLMRLWENVRNLTLKSTAPCLVYEEGSLIKRSVRDLYNKDIGEVIVSGEAGYREAKDFMKMLMPSHAKAVQPYRDPRPIFAKNGIEAQLDQMLSPQVTLKSGGYLIINQTEALVAVDVNSGRSTRENSIEDTALQTNLEAAEEVARQLRLRDLAGLVVIDFIDMEEKRNNRAVEKKVKECLKLDRARIQVGRISHFGLLEMSRQRIRASVLESTMQTCPHCAGTGYIRSDSSIALHILRAVEEQLLKTPNFNVNVRTNTDVALYILNHKRDTLIELEQRFGADISVTADRTIKDQDFVVEKGEASTREAQVDISQIALSPDDAQDASSDEAQTPVAEADGDAEDNNAPRKRKRRRRRRKGASQSAQDQNGEAQDQAEHNTDFSDVTTTEDEQAVDADNAQSSSDERGDQEERKKRRRRGKRGGRKNRERENGEVAAIAGQETETVAQSEDGSLASVAKDAPQDAKTAKDDTSETQSEMGDTKPFREPTEDGVMAAAAIAMEQTSTAVSDTDAPNTSDASSPSQDDASSSHEVAPETKSSRRAQTDLNAIASEPVVTSSNSSDKTENAPKKTGWWRRGSFF